MPKLQRARVLGVWSALSLYCALLQACGGAATAASPATAANAVDSVTPPAPPPIPQDLWQLVPADAMVVAELDAAQIRQWAHYATLQRWLTQYACVPIERWSALLERTELVVGGLGPIGDGEQNNGALLLRGRFNVEDAQQLVDALDPGGHAKQHDRWQAYETTDLMSVLLDEHTLLIAHGNWRDEVLKLADGASSANVRATPFVTELTPQVQGGGVLTVMAAPSAVAAHAVLRDLERVGGSAAAIAKHLKAQPFWALRAALKPDHAGVEAFGVAAGGTEASATGLIEALNSAFWQAGLFMRLIGLPPVLTNAELQHTGTVATVAMRATGDEATTLITRLEELVKGSARQCTQSAAIAAPATTPAAAQPTTGTTP